MYEFTSHIRYSECAPDARLSLPGLVNYFQDCAVFHAIDVGRGPDTWKNEHYGWVITSWQIIVNEYPMVGEEVTTATWAYKFKGFEADRNLTMRNREGKLLAYANSSWAYFDTAALRPLRVPSYELDAYGIDPELPMENKAPRRIRIPDERYRTRPEIRIRVEHLDSNGHVNNEQYIALMIACLPAGIKVEELRVQYISQAHLGDTLIPKVWHEGNEYIVWLELDGKSCCTSYFRIREGETLVPIAPGVDLAHPKPEQKRIYNMIELGKMQKLVIVRREKFGVYVGETADADPEERVLLPAKQVPEGAREGDEITVFIYRDSSDRMIATTTRPKVLLGAVAALDVKQVTKIGAFLDWGLEKDLLLPFHEQTRRVREGEEILAALYVDKSGRLAATMKLYPYLRQDPPYQIGDTVTGTVYENAHNFGTFVAVDSMYSGMIPKREAPDGYPVGQVLALRVTNVKEDGKLDLTAKRKAYEQMDTDADRVLARIHDDFEGVLPFSDKADPEKIREVFGLSKAAFKRAVGKLYKERKIVIEEESIREI